MQRAAGPVEAFVVIGGSRYPVPPHGLRIGRSPDNDVVLPDANVSRQHLLIWSAPHGVFLRDLGSQNGTYIGSRRVGLGPEPIAPGDRVRLGRTELYLDQQPAAGGSLPSAARSIGLIFGGIAALFFGIVALTGYVAFNAITASPTATPAAIALATQTTPVATQAATTTPVPSPTVVAVAPTLTPVPSPTPNRRDAGLVRALGAAVRVIVPVGGSQASIGSGTIITERGHILTNFHVVADENTRQLINQGRNVVIAVPSREGGPAEPRYRANVVQHDAQYDFALLRIATMNDGAPLPANLELAPVPVGDSDEVRIGDTITIVGYPGLGGDRVTVTRGIHSGFTTYPNEPGEYFKTDTEISPGNSGGTAINAEGELIGVPTAGRVNREAVGKLGLIRPINQAKALIDRAKQDR